VDDDNDGLHLEPSVTSRVRRIFGCTIGLAGFPEVARCYTIGPGIVTPNRRCGDNCRRRYGKAVPSFRRRANPDLMTCIFLL
jgi:hypothetical protein